MTVSSGGHGDDPQNEFEDDGHMADDDNDLEATRILPMRTSAPSTPGSVIGTSSETDPDSDADDEKTYFMPTGAEQQDVEPSFNPTVGWLVILDGPGRGEHCSVYYGQNSIGRGEQQRIRLNFGDARITRDTHAFLIYDDLARKYFLRDNGKANLVRLNNVAVMAPTEIKDRDIIKIGETEMLFVALCGPDFDWLEGDDGPNTGTEA